MIDMTSKTGERIIKPKVDRIKSNPLLLSGIFSGCKGIEARYFG
jgi:hypothetical protein